MPLHARFSDVLSNVSFTFSNWNLTATASAGVSRIAMADIGRASGKWYFEFTLDTQIASGFCSAGILQQEHSWNNVYVGQDATIDGAGYYVQQAATEGTYRGGTLNTTGALTVVQGDVIGVAVDLDNGRIWFSVNGTWLDSGNPGAGTGARYTGLSGSYRPAVSARSGEQWTANFGSQPFSYSVPAGFNPGWYAEETAIWVTDDDKTADQGRCNIEEDGRSVRWALDNFNFYGSAGTRGSALLSNNRITKWYWEVEVLDGTLAEIGFCNDSFNLDSGPSSSGNCYVASQAGGAFFCGSTSSGSLTFGIGDTLGFAVDMGAGTVDVYLNGVSTLTGLCSLSGILYPLVYGNCVSGDQTEVRAAWKAADFAYTPPADYEGPGDFDPQFAWDPTEKGSGVTLHRSDFLAENTTDNHNVFADSGVLSAGKWYWEVVGTNGIEDARVGVAEASYSHTTAIGASSESYAVLTLDGNKQASGGSSTAYCAGGNIDNHEVIGVALDMDNGRIFFSVDGVWCASGDPAAGTNAAFTGITTPMVPAVSGSEDVTLGNSWLKLVSHPSFMTYQPPAGFKHLDEYEPPIFGDGDVDIELGIDSTGRLTFHGDGDVNVELGIEATGDLKTRHGDGDLDIELEIDSTGRVTVHGDGDLDIDLTLVGIGEITRAGAGDPDISLELDGTGVVTPALRGDGDVDITLDLTSSGSSGRPLSGDVTLPLLDVEAISITGTVSQGAITLPVFTVDGVIAPQTNIILPILQVDASIKAGLTLRSDVTLPMLELEASAGPQASISADILLPRFVLQGSISAGNSASADISLPGLAIEGEALVGAVIDGDVELPSLLVDAQARPPLEIEADIELPLLLLDARGHADISALLTLRAYSINTESLGAMPYSAFNYHALGRVGNQVFGVNDTGFYLLEGTDDDGSDIDAEFSFGITDFGDIKGIDPELKKRVTDAYVGYRGDGDMLLSLTLDGEVAPVRTYRLRRRTQDTGLRQRRANLNRGDKSRYWQLKMENVNGSNFEIDTIGLLVGQTTRKIG